jgi:hypothetical protein
MRITSIALLGSLAAALTLAACGNNDDDTPEDPVTPAAEAPAETPTPAAEPPAMAADTPAPAAETPAPAAETPAPAADAPAMAADTPAVALTLADVVGLWAETTEACATADTLTIAPDVIATGPNACIITAIEETATGLTVNILCPVTGGEPNPMTWTIAATGAAPFNQITVAMGEEMTTFVRCAATP